MERLRAFRKIANQHVGFVVCDRDMTIVAIVDSQGARPGHQSARPEARGHQATLPAGGAGEVPLRVSAATAALSRIARADPRSRRRPGLRRTSGRSPRGRASACAVAAGSASARPATISAPPPSMFERDASSRNRNPHSTPNSGIRNVTVSARAGPDVGDQLEIDEVGDRRRRDGERDDVGDRPAAMSGPGTGANGSAGSEHDGGGHLAAQAIEKLGTPASLRLAYTPASAVAKRGGEARARSRARVSVGDRFRVPADEHHDAREAQRHPGDLAPRQRLAEPDRRGDRAEERARRIEDRARRCA